MRNRMPLLAGFVLASTLAATTALADNTSTNTSNNTSTNTSSDRRSSNSSSNQSSNSSAYWGRDDYRRDERSDVRGTGWRSRQYYELIEYYDPGARRWRLGYRYRLPEETPARYRIYRRD